MKSQDIIVVGAGISGCVIAERYSTVLHKHVLIIEKRDHVGGNCHDYINNIGILIPMHGPHFFHANSEAVWEYVNEFSDWIPYEHKVLSVTDGKLVPVPVNITTVNKLFDLNIKTEEEMTEWLDKNTEKIEQPKNSEEAALRRVGKALYEKMFKHYTKKQWDMWPIELDPSIMDRIPVRTNFDDRYFADKYQGMPKYGYTKMFEKMLDNGNITVLLGKSWDDVKNKIPGFKKLFFTGPIDQYFQYKFGEKLQYRSLRFEFEDYDSEFYQTATTINFPFPDVPYTRITEIKHATGQKSDKTTIIREYPAWEGEPYYPVLSDRNIRIYSRYKREAQALEKEGVYFVGRMANYKYFNMDQAFENAFGLFDKIERSYKKKRGMRKKK